MMESVANGEGKLSPSAAAKKLKQTRLPFQVLSGSPTTSPASPTISTPTVARKRKPSVETEAIRAAKIGRISEVKENVKDTASVVILDDESNSTDLVDVRKEDQKLVVVKVDAAPRTPKRDGGEASGEPGRKSVGKEKGDKFMIKLPVSKKKAKKTEDGGDQSVKKKASKDKKKSKKESKAKKAIQAKADDVTETVMIDDSDLSEVENETEAEVEEVPEIILVAKDTSEDKQEHVTEINEVKDSKDNNKELKIETEEHSTAEKKGSTAEEPETTKEKDIANQEENDDQPAKNKIESSEEKPDEKLTEDQTHDKTEQDKLDEKPAEETVNTPRRARLSRAVTQKPETETKKEKVTPKRERKSKNPASLKKSTEDKEVSPPKSETKQQDAEKPSGAVSSKSPKDVEKPGKARSSKAAGSAKKLDSSKEEVDSQKEDKKKKDTTKGSEEEKKPVKGALDKFFAKALNKEKASLPNGTIDAVKENKSKEEPSQMKEVPRTPEKVKSSKLVSESVNPEVDQEANPNNSTIVSICLDDTSDGNTADDEENAYMLCTPNSKERSLVLDSAAEKKLTPKQMARRREAELKLALKQQELDEKKRKRQEEKDAKVREKEEQERLRKKEREEKEEQKRKEREEKEDQKRKEREEKEEQKRKEKDDKEKKRLAEVEAKNEEKRKKDEQKEEERKKKEEEKEAEEKRKQKTAQAFQSFFVKKSTGRDVKVSDDENSMEQQQFCEGEFGRQTFMPFCVKGDMRLAPVVRACLAESRRERLDEILKKSSDENGNDAVVANNVKELYLGQLKNEKYVVGKGDRTLTGQDDEGEDDDVMIVDDDVCHQIEVDQSAGPTKRFRAKFFLFEENRRPPFRGTWGKRSNKIKPRRPFVQDTKFFDYEVDSDDEWEEEEPGESLHGSDDEKDVDPEEDYEVDNDFFVPHGHLSDEEMQAEDDIMDDNSPEAQKAKLKIMQQEFAAEMKKKTEKIKPRLIGCLWENAAAGSEQRPECSAVIWEILKARAMLFDPEEPISFTVQKSEPESSQSTPSKEKETTERKPKQIKLVDEGVKELITLVHGCAQNRKFLVKEFLAYWAKRRDEGEFNVPQFAPDSIRIKIGEISSWRPCPDEGLMQNKMCWYVNKEALKKYELIDLKVPTGWNFILKPITKSKKEKKEKEPAAGGEDEEKKTPPKKDSPEEKEKKERLQSAVSSASKPKTPAASITKFTKKLYEDDKRKQFAKQKKVDSPSASGSGSSSSTSASNRRKSTGAGRKSASASKTIPASTSSPAASASSSAAAPDGKPKQKKRVQLLMSGPRGQNLNQTTKNNLISQFLAKGDSSSKKKTDSSSRAGQEAMEVDPPISQCGDAVIVLDD